jgi:hypothetical protein
MKRFLPIVVFSLIALNLSAQEFIAKVTINTPKLQKTDPKIFQTLQQAITDFFNTRKWSEDEYKPDERIEVNISITVDQELSDTKFSGQMTFQSSRPIYNSTYGSVMLMYLDKDFVFDYREFEPLDFSDNQFFSNLTSVLGFYAYVSLGLDYDSFSEFGGENYFQKAMSVINNVPQNIQSDYPGWKPFGSTRNRYWIIENILSVKIKNLRSSIYQYHLNGLDNLVANPALGVSNVKKALDEWQKANNSYPQSMIMQLLCTAKREEIVNIFSVADMKIRQDVFDIMAKLDGANVESYRKLMK